MSTFEFPVGYHKFHKNQLFNYQLNRWYSFGYADYDDFMDAGKRIHSFADWKREMLRLAEKAVAEKQLLRAAFSYRAAEFYLLDESPEKVRLYDQYRQLFYQAVEDDYIERFAASYQDAFLPGIRIPAVREKKDTIVMHGGFDSFIEEFYSMMTFFSRHGYEVIAFEGPGQGAARREYDLAFNIEWEKPVKAILDHFQLSTVTLLGISLGMPSIT
ncbi:MAG: hypothetical protein ACE5GL_06485 [Calditrichia bacterium]